MDVADIHFTKDAAEAVTLATAGIPFADPNRRCVNTYPDKVLRKHGKSAAQMVKEGIPGEIWWGFEKVPELAKVLEDFAAVFKGAGGTVTDLPELSTRQLALVAMTTLKNRATFAGDWKVYTPRVRIDRGDGRYTICTKDTPAHVLEAWGLTKTNQ
jgi:hypothetical protein